MLKRLSKASIHKALADKTEQITDKDLDNVLTNEGKVTEKVTGAAALKAHLTTVQRMFSLIKAYWRGDYRQIPWFSIAAIASALLYVLSPLDLIPDFIPVIGLLDDAMVLTACLNLVNKDLMQFEVWRQARQAQ